jgi:hypothetical protein
LSTLQHYILFLLTPGRYIQSIFTYAKNVSLVYKGRVSVFFHNFWPLIAKLTAAGIDKHDNEECDVSQNNTVNTQNNNNISVSSMFSLFFGDCFEMLPLSRLDVALSVRI